MKGAVLLVLIAALLTSGIATITAAKLPSTIKLCKKNDPYINECLKSSIENAIRVMKPGLPELQMLPVDPLSVTKISIQEGAGRPVHINLDLNNCSNTGFSETKIEAARIDFDKHIIETDILLRSAILNADYVMNGQFLVLPLKGSGKCKLEFTGLTATLQLRAQPKTKNDKDYWDVVHSSIVIHNLQDLKIHFENLFNGDKILSESTNRVLNENWKQFWSELKPSFEQTYAEVFLQLSKIVFGKVPEKYIFLD